MRYHAKYSATCTLNTRVTPHKETSCVTFIRARAERIDTHTTTMQSSMLSSTRLSPPRFSTSFSKRGQNITRRQNKHNLRVYAKDFPKPEQIDKTENYRIAGDLSKRFAVRRPCAPFLMIKRECLLLFLFCFVSKRLTTTRKRSYGVPLNPQSVFRRQQF